MLTMPRQHVSRIAHRFLCEWHLARREGVALDIHVPTDPKLEAEIRDRVRRMEEEYLTKR